MSFFPTAVPTVANLQLAINNTKVTLAVDAGIGDTTITVDDASALQSTGYLTFSDNDASPETISYTGKSGNNLTGVTRGADGTSAGTHVSGAFLEMRWNAAYHNLLVTEIIAACQNIVNRFGLGTDIVVPSARTFTLAATTNQIILGTTNTTTISSTAPASSRTYTIPDAGGNVQFVMAGGTQTIAGAKTFSSAVVINPTTNQLVLGVTNTTTISATAPASSAVYTIPDVGTTANFVMSAGTQIVAGSKTFSADVTISGNHALIINDGEGTPKAVTIKTPATLTSNWTMTLPVDGGTNTYLLSTNGSGTLSWVAPSAGTVNSGTAGNVAYYATSTTAVSTTAAFTVGSNGPNGIIVGTNTNDSAASGKVGEYIESVVSGVSATGSSNFFDVTSITLSAGDWDVTCSTRADSNGTWSEVIIGISTTTGNSSTGLVDGSNKIVEEWANTATANTAFSCCVPSYRMSVSGSTIVYLKARSSYTAGTPTYAGRLSARRMR